MLGNNFKTILKEERWSKLPTFTVFSRRKSEAAMGRSGGYCILGCRIDYKQCCGSGSGIRNPVPFWPLDPGSGKGFFQIPDLGSQIPNPYFWELSDNFLGEKSYNSWKLAQIFFFSISKRKWFSVLWKERPSYWRSLQLSKEAIQHFKTWNFLIFFTFVGHFCPPGSGFRIGIWIHWSDWIRIRIRIRIRYPA